MKKGTEVDIPSTTETYHIVHFKERVLGSIRHKSFSVLTGYAC